MWSAILGLCTVVSETLPFTVFLVQSHGSFRLKECLVRRLSLPLVPVPSLLTTVAGFVMRVEPHNQAKKPTNQQSSSDAQEWIDKLSRCNREIEQLRRAVEDSAMELQLVRGSQAEYMARCDSLTITLSSKELQLQSVLSQAAAEKSSFVQEKEHLQLLFDMQQELCVGLTSQVVALTASCERLQCQLDENSMLHQAEQQKVAIIIAQKDAAIAFEQQKRLEEVALAQAQAARLEFNEVISSYVPLAHCCRVG
jgi:chromosome segregation ATPase